MVYQMIKLTSDNSGLYHLQMADEKGKNALSHQMIHDLLEAFQEIRNAPDAKSLLLSGTPDYFCTGASAEMIQEISDGNLAANDIDLAIELISFPIPVIASLQGSAVGGGLVLALCSDISIASESSRYGFNFTDLGFTPGMGTTGLLPDLIGYQRAAEMMMTGKMYKGRELQQMGLFNYVVEQDAVANQSREIAERLTDKPIHVLKTLKEYISKPRIKRIEEVLQKENEMHTFCFKHDETRSQIKRNFTGNHNS